jgi:hypothetical protein
VYIINANLEGAKFREAHYLTFEQLSKMKTFHGNYFVLGMSLS